MSLEFENTKEQLNEEKITVEALVKENEVWIFDCESIR